ncbi:MAG: response regulator [Caulobacterales bacterium]
MSLLVTLAPHLPFLRRYARALTGDQSTGDNYVRAALQAFTAGAWAPESSLSPRAALYHAFHAIWRSSGAQLLAREANDLQSEGGPGRRLMRVSPRSRQAFLLTALEGFSLNETAQILAVGQEEVERLIVAAQADIDAELATSVLIIEDEPVIAADIEHLITDMGHRVTSVAATRKEAVDAAGREAPGLVLADIQLADGSSGLDAVTDILRGHDAPVIFVTALPERLLTGDRPEPTFLITKPFQPSTLKAAVGQPLFFHPRRRTQDQGERLGLSLTSAD